MRGRLDRAGGVWVSGLPPPDPLLFPASEILFTVAQADGSAAETSP